ncbi:MAG: histidinol-phosphate transaminase [Alphaproteobacteria bacterium]
MTAAPLPKSGILDIKPYIGGEGRMDAVQNPVRLASNENVLGCSPLARAAYLACAGDLNRYPDGAAADLRAAIGKAYGLNPDNIVCGAGSDELISLIVRAYAGMGDEVIYSQYGFLMYPISAKSAGATPVAVPEKDMRTDVDALLAAVTPKTKILLLANPNNPTGSYLTKAEMQKLRAGLPASVLLVVDAAYAEFAQMPDYEDGRALVEGGDNTVMLRTFSKIHGLAALRLGWGYFPADVAGVINRVRGAFNVSAPAQAAGIAALQDKDFVQKTIDMTNAGRAQLSEGLSGMGFKVWPSVTNFILVRFGDNAEQIRLGLKQQGIFIRQMGAYNLPDHLRITIGTRDDNARLLSELRQIV